MTKPCALTLASRARPAAPQAMAFDRVRQERFACQLRPSPWADQADEAALQEGEGDSRAQALQDDEVQAVDARDPGTGQGGAQQDAEQQGEDSPPQQEPPAAPPAFEQAAWLPQAWQAMPVAISVPPAPGGEGRAQGDAAQDPGGQAAAGAVPQVAAVSSAEQAPPWLQDVVQQVAQLCAQGDPRFQCWSVTLPMDPAVLPDCELRLALSPGAMTLRFRTGSALASALVSRHGNALRAQLAALPSAPALIDIDLE